MITFSLNTSEDLRNNKNEIENVENGIDLFNGVIIDRMKEMFRNRIKELIEINSIKFIQILMENQGDDEIFLKGDFFNDYWEHSKIQMLKKNFRAYATINFPKERIVTKPKVEFKMIIKRRFDNRYHWERGFNRYIHLDIIKNYIIDLFEKGQSLKHFKVQFENNKYYEDTFSYDFKTKTLAIECKYRGYEMDSYSRI